MVPPVLGRWHLFSRAINIRPDPFPVPCSPRQAGVQVGFPREPPLPPPPREAGLGQPGQRPGAASWVLPSVDVSGAANPLRDNTHQNRNLLTGGDPAVTRYRVPLQAPLGALPNWETLPQPSGCLGGAGQLPGPGLPFRSPPWLTLPALEQERRACPGRDRGQCVGCLLLSHGQVGAGNLLGSHRAARLRGAGGQGSCPQRAEHLLDGMPFRRRSRQVQRTGSVSPNGRQRRGRGGENPRIG